MITVQELMTHCIERENSLMAHLCFWAITTQGVTPEQNSDVLKQLSFDQMAITELVKSNILGIGQIKLFVIGTGNNIYAFYFAKSGFEARAHHSYLFGQQAQQVVEAKKLLYTKMLWADSEQEMTLLEYRKTLVDYPAYVGHAKGGQHVLYKLGRGVKQVV